MLLMYSFTQGIGAGWVTLVSLIFKKMEVVGVVVLSSLKTARACISL
jgi:hypothetical protein